MGRRFSTEINRLLSGFPHRLGLAKATPLSLFNGWVGRYAMHTINYSRSFSGQKGHHSHHYHHDGVRVNTKTPASSSHAHHATQSYFHHDHDDAKTPSSSRSKSSSFSLGRPFPRLIDAISDGWSWELFCLAVSWACLVAIGVLLGAHDGKPFPTGPGGISLNAMIAILSTVAKSSLMCVVSAVLGQMKWDWFEAQPRRLDQLEIFDDASRGPLGATRFLLGGTVRSLATLGALVMMLGLAIDPFVQQLVGRAQISFFVPSSEVWTGKMSLPTFFPGGFADLQSAEAAYSPSNVMDSDTDYFSALNSAFWSDESQYRRRAHCPSGDCQFEPFSTLEFCVESGKMDTSTMAWRCNNTFDRAKFNNLTFENQLSPLTEPDGQPHDWCGGWFGPNKTDPMGRRIIYNWEATGAGPVAKSMPTLPAIHTPMSIIHDITLDNLTLKKVSPIIKRNTLGTFGHLRFGIGRKNESRRVTLHSAEWAVLGLCQTTIRVTVVNGTTFVSRDRDLQFGTVIDSTRTGIPPDDGSYAQCFTPDPSLSFPTTAETETNLKFPYPSGPVRTLNEINYTANAATSTFCAQRLEYDTEIKRRMRGAILLAIRYNQTLGNFNATDPKTWKEAMGFNAVRREFDPIGEANMGSEEIHRRVQEKGLAYMVRSVTGAFNNISLARSEERVTGSIRVTEVVVSVRWAWLILPLGLEVVGLVLLVLVWWRRGRRTAGEGGVGVGAGVWKTSILPVLYHGLERNDPALRGGNWIKLSDMQSAARSRQVKLQGRPREDGRAVLAAG